MAGSDLSFCVIKERGVTAFSTHRSRAGMMQGEGALGQAGSVVDGEALITMSHG